MALIISLLCNSLIIYISRNENLLGFYLHTIHIRLVVKFLSTVADTVDIRRSLWQRTKTDFCLMSKWPSYPNIMFSMLLQNKVTWILEGKQCNIYPHCVFSVHFLSTNIFLSSNLFCTWSKRLSEVLRTIVPFLSSLILGTTTYKSTKSYH